MFGVPDDAEAPTPRKDDTPPPRGTFLDPHEEEEPWPFGRNRAVFFLNERVSPDRFTIHDRRFIITMVISLLIHLMIFSQLLDNSSLNRLIAAARMKHQAALIPQEKEEIRPFVLYDAPPVKSEPPRSPGRAPLSDLDRRAHGGSGDPAERPGVANGEGLLPVVPPRAGGSPGQPFQREEQSEDGAGRAERGRGQDERDGQGALVPTPSPDKVASGADAVLQVPRSGGPAGGAPLRGLGRAGGPGMIGGVAPGGRGGRVDLGPLSFETEWYDWGPYAAEMLRRIRYHWQIPEIAQIGVAGIVRIHFVIERDGRVTGTEILWQSGHPSMDFAARDAIVNASPLPPLPPDLTGVDREGVTITFYYNTPVPEDANTG